MATRRPVRVVRLNDPVRGSYYIAIVGGVQACGETARLAQKNADIRAFRDTYGRSTRPIKQDV